MSEIDEKKPTTGKIIVSFIAWILAFVLIYKISTAKDSLIAMIGLGFLFLGFCQE